MKTGSMRRCLLVAGGLNTEYNHLRYGHELCWWAERLTPLGYSCWMCLADGIAPEPIPDSIKFTSAKRENVEAGLEWLAGVEENGFGLLVISNHGDRSGICLWGPDILTVDQLGTALFGAPDDAPQPEPARRPLSLLDAFHWARAQDRRQETPMIFDPNGLAAEIITSKEYGD